MPVATQASPQFDPNLPTLGVYVDAETAEGRALLDRLDEQSVRYEFVPTRGTPPKVQYGLRRVFGTERILAYLAIALRT